MDALKRENDDQTLEACRAMLEEAWDARELAGIDGDDSSYLLVEKLHDAIEGLREAFEVAREAKENQSMQRSTNRNSRKIVPSGQGSARRQSVGTLKLRTNGTYELVRDVYSARSAPLSTSSSYEMLPPSMMRQLRSFSIPEYLQGYGLVKTFAVYFLVIVLISFVVLGIIKLEDPYYYGGNRDTWFFVGTTPIVTAFCTFGVCLGITKLANAKLPLNRIAAISISCGVTAAGVYSIPRYAFGTFPLPFGIIIQGVVVGGQSLLIVFFSYKQITRHNARFRAVLLSAAALVSFAVSVAISLALYYAVFKRASGTAESVIALGLPVIKLFVKIISKKIAYEKCNPHFVHGIAFFIEVAVAIFSAILFTSIDSTVCVLFLFSLLFNEPFCSFFSHR